MDVSSASWLVIAVALVLANLPFFNESVFGFIPLGRDKPLWVRLLELVVLYFVVGLLARLLEGRIGSVFEQSKEFYMLTVPLFVTLAFPGFVVRYLRKRHH
ncbi:DUF2818 family protein [Massilia sp. TWR1-2-2]|uniref:DUF2818 family protein n=1 Tax=Massilia sp. TWR1-2-2 TaxID=2804584 RepID=UPI003CEB66B2